MSAFFLSPVWAANGKVEGIAVEAGTGNKTQFIRMSVQSVWERSWVIGKAVQLCGYWDVSLAQWRGNQYQNQAGAHQNITDIGITPVVRLEAVDRTGWYGEAGIGAHYLSALYDNNGRRLSTHFQFGDHLGAGYRFNNNLDVGIRLQHFSNGGYKKPNNGVNFAVLRVAYPF